MELRYILHKDRLHDPLHGIAAVPRESVAVKVIDERGNDLVVVKKMEEAE